MTPPRPATPAHGGLPTYRVTGQRVHYEPSRGRRWEETFVTLVYAINADDALGSVEKDTIDSENTDCYGLVAVRLSATEAAA